MKPKKLPLNQNGTPQTHTEFWSLTSTHKGLHDNTEEQQYFLVAL